jgi:hypothetical protein
VSRTLAVKRMQKCVSIDILHAPAYPARVPQNAFLLTIDLNFVSLTSTGNSLRRNLMGKTILGRIVQRFVMLSVLAACLGVTVTAPANVQAAASCPNLLRRGCIENDGIFYAANCICSYREDVYACEQAGGTWNYQVAQCQF